MKKKVTTFIVQCRQQSRVEIQMLSGHLGSLSNSLPQLSLLTFQIYKLLHVVLSIQVHPKITNNDTEIMNANLSIFSNIGRDTVLKRVFG